MSNAVIKVYNSCTLVWVVNHLKVTILNNIKHPAFKILLNFNIFDTEITKVGTLSSWRMLQIIMAVKQYCSVVLQPDYIMQISWSIKCSSTFFKAFVTSKIVSWVKVYFAAQVYYKNKKDIKWHCRKLRSKYEPGAARGTTVMENTLTFGFNHSGLSLWNCHK